jgi:hypothetical protein
MLEEIAETSTMPRARKNHTLGLIITTLAAYALISMLSGCTRQVKSNNIHYATKNPIIYQLNDRQPPNVNSDDDFPITYSNEPGYKLRPLVSITIEGNATE